MFHRCVGALVGLAMMGMAGSANAILIQANDPTLIGPTDDGFNLTQDTDTGLEWLDLTLSTGFSYDQVIGGAGGFLVAGFSIATVTQVDTFFIDAGATDLLGASLAVQFSSAQTLIDLLGCTKFCGDNEVSQGVAEAMTLEVGFPFVRIFDGDGIFEGSGGTTCCFALKALSDPTFGVFLVRPIPEPATIALFGIGLAPGWAS